MKKVLAGLLGVAIFYSAPVDARPIKVEGGEHNGFTRLAMVLPSGVSWELVGTGGNRVVEFQNHSDGFDLRRVFLQIPKKRITDVSSTESVLTLSLPCNCKIVAFQEANGVFVLDLYDGEPLQLEPDVSATTREIAPKKPIPSSTPVPGSEFAFGELLWEGQVPENLPPRDLPDLARVEEAETPNQNRNNIEDLIEQTRQQLILGLGEAATRGILDVVATLPDVAKDELPTREEEIFDSSDLETRHNNLASGNIRVTTSQDIPETAQRVLESSLGLPCGDEETVNIPNWVNEGSFDQVVGELRADLFGELDKLNETTALRLVRTYIYFGFGAEAKQLLELIPDSEKNFPELLDIANLIDGNQDHVSRILHNFPGCDTDLALWGVLSAQNEQQALVFNAKAAIRGLEKLPDHLRFLLGSKLIERLTDLGEHEWAEGVLRTLEHGPETDQPVIKLAKATLKNATNDANTAEQLLNEVIEENSFESPSALIQYVDEHLAADDTIRPDIAVLIEAYSYEYRNDPLGPALDRAHILASLKTGQFAKARQALKEFGKRGSGETYVELEDQVMLQIVRNADDSSFLDLMFDAISAPRDRVVSETSISAGNRLLDLGFPKVAKDFMNQHAGRSNSDNEITLFARIALLEGQNNQVLLLLSEVEETPKSKKLKAEALRNIGAFEEAQRLLNELDDTSLSSENAWLSDNWQNSVPLEDPLFGQLHKVASEEIQPILVDEGMLARSETTLEESKAARDSISQLLADLPVVQE